MIQQEIIRQAARNAQEKAREYADNKTGRKAEAAGGRRNGNPICRLRRHGRK